jgi:hypothetical protein
VTVREDIGGDDEGLTDGAFGRETAIVDLRPDALDDDTSRLRSLRRLGGGACFTDRNLWRPAVHWI